jgi:2-aminobenzoate-CoA ligase
MNWTAHTDTFARDHLPAKALQPEFLFDLPEVQYPEHLNCAVALLDQAVSSGRGSRVVIRAPGLTWTYQDLLEQANRIAHVLTEDLKLQPGNRVLLHGFNNPMMVACWFGIVKAGGIVVATMPLLRSRELTDVITKAEVSHALFDHRLEAELNLARPNCPSLTVLSAFGNTVQDGLEARMASKNSDFASLDTHRDDVVLIAFTSGTTGKPKGCMHYHRDVLAVCDTFARHILKAQSDDVFIGSPPLAFTFGLGGIVLFPMRIGASTVLLEKATPEVLLPALAEYRASVVFTSPTAYRAMAPHAKHQDLSNLRKCVSAGEALPAATRSLWRDTTGIELIDGIGATEMLHIFISADEVHSRPGATGKPVPGYTACVLDDEGQPLPQGQVGRLAVKGPTGCRYLDDIRQRNYVQNGWNVTGDAYLMDQDGFFHYQARTDDMIISSGYNIAGPEVEGALLMHPGVAECAVIGVPDPERGQIVKAVVVLRPGMDASGEMAKALQDFVKQTIAPYKYPRTIEFRDSLPKTQTGKLQRFRLRQETIEAPKTPEVAETLKTPEVQEKESA